MSQHAWQRRSSSLKVGGRFSQDPSKGTQRFVDRNTKIPRSTSQTSLNNAEPGCLVRSKSTLGPNYTPQEKSKVTPQPHLFTPLLSSVSSKKSTLYKDRRNLQDKEYQKEAFANVLSYFQNNYSGNLKASDIRYPTIKMFVELMNHLFERLGLYNKDELIQFTPSNYEKDVPHWMQSLKYPINSNKSWLKTVNVPQCWPNVLGLLSWLVSLVQASAIFDLETHLNEEIDEGQSSRFAVAYFKGCLAAHNRGDLGEGLEQICMDVVRFSEEINGVTDDVIQDLQDDIAKLYEMFEDPTFQAEKDIRDELLQKLTIARNQSIKATEDIEQKVEAIEEIKNNISKKERHIASMKIEMERMRKEAESLQNKVKSQSMSVTEFVETQKKCDFLLKEISYTEKECEDNENLIARYEHDMALKRDKILQQASTFNRHVIQLEQHVPELKGLRARTNPESTDVKEEVERLVQALRDLKARFVAEWSDLEVFKNEKEMSLSSLKKRLNESMSLENTIRERLLTKKSEIDQLQINIAEKEKSFKHEIDELEKSLVVRQQKHEENMKKRAHADDLKKRMDLIEKCKVKMDELVENMWLKIEERAELCKSQIAELQLKINSHEKEVDSWISGFLAKYKK